MLPDLESWAASEQMVRAWEHVKTNIVSPIFESQWLRKDWSGIFPLQKSSYESVLKSLADSLKVGHLIDLAKIEDHEPVSYQFVKFGILTNAA